MIHRAITLLDRWTRHPAVLPGLVVALAVFGLFQVSAAVRAEPLTAYDTHAYYQASALDDPYRSTINGGFDAVGGRYEYKYAPPLAQALYPLHWIPWPAFMAGWLAAMIAAYLAMTRNWALPLLFFPPVLGELYLGNVNLFIALAVVLGFRWPAAWAFVILTKITPGVGLLWFVVRREWRSLAVALGLTAVIAAVSFVLAPHLWSDFLEASKTQTDATLVVPRQAAPINLPIRIALAAAVTVFAALTNRRWLVPVAVAISVPFLWWNVLAILVACVPLARREKPGATFATLPAPG